MDKLNTKRGQNLLQLPKENKSLKSLIELNFEIEFNNNKIMNQNIKSNKQNIIKQKL